MDNIEFARENEQFAQDLKGDYSEKKNWMVIINFYSLVHYIEESLNRYNFSSSNHTERKGHIRDCRQIDNRVRSLYRKLEDTSKDARYDCHIMEDEDVEESEKTLEEAKELLNFHTGGGNTKYST